MLSENSELDLDAPWRIGRDSLKALIADVSGLDPGCIVEFGSGASSIQLALAFPGAEILSIDHDPEFFHQTEALKHQFAPVSKLTVSLRPLHWQREGLAWYLSYLRGPFPESIDAVIIDGPPGLLTQRGREACLHQVYRHLRTGGRVYLDDFERPAEQQIVENWLRSYPGVFEQYLLDVGHRICVLKKVAEGKLITAWGNLWDNYHILYQHGRKQKKPLKKKSTGKQ